VKGLLMIAILLTSPIHKEVIFVSFLTALWQEKWILDRTLNWQILAPYMVYCIY
jgi:hypothetical protein